jgi:hypothetical protein
VAKKTLRKKISDEPIGVMSLILALFVFLVPLGRDVYKQWELSKQPKFNLSCEGLSETKAFYQGKHTPGTRQHRWDVAVQEPPISGFVGSLAQCEFYNLQSTTISVREIVNTYYYDRFISDELPNFREYFDTEKTDRLIDVPFKFPIAVAPGTGLKFRGLFLFPVGDLASVKDEQCQQSLKQGQADLSAIGYCVNKLHGKPLVNLLYEGQVIGFGEINSVGLKIVLGDRLEIHYKPSTDFASYIPNDKDERLRDPLERLRRDPNFLNKLRGRKITEEVWVTYPEEKNYVRVGNQYMTRNSYLWSVLFFLGLLFMVVTIAYSSRNAVRELVDSVWPNKKNSTLGK